MRWQYSSSLPSPCEVSSSPLLRLFAAAAAAAAAVSAAVAISPLFLFNKQFDDIRTQN